MVWQFIKDLFIGVFWSVGGITTWVGIVALILFFLPLWEGKMKNFLEKYRKPYAIYIFSWFILISVILTSYSVYKTKQQQINELQKQIDDMKQVENSKKTAARIPSSKKRSARPHQSLSEPKLRTLQLTAVEVKEPNK